MCGQSQDRIFYCSGQFLVYPPPLYLSLSLPIHFLSHPQWMTGAFSIHGKRLIRSRMALFPPSPFTNIKIQSGQPHPSSISDLIGVVLPPVPPSPSATEAQLYDTK